MKTAQQLLIFFTLLALSLSPVTARTQKPVLHGQHWVAITGKPLAATSGAMMFQQGGNAGGIIQGTVINAIFLIG